MKFQSSMHPEFENQSSSRHSSESGGCLLIEPEDFDQLLAECLDRLLLAAPLPLEHLQELRSYLPEASVSTRKFILVELIKIDMAMAAENGQIRCIDLYAQAIPDLLPSNAIPLDLVMEEIQLRKEFGETPSRDDYQNRFPQFRSMLAHLDHVSEATSAGRKLGPPPEYECGSRIDDFMLVQQLGKGAFATVYLALQVSMQRMVALKVSRGKGDESQALAQFDHTNIVRVYDQRAVDNEKIHLLYMQFQPGGTLADVVKNVRKLGNIVNGRALLDSVDRRLSETSQAIPEASITRRWIEDASWPGIVAWVGMQLANALDDAHRHGVLHRDVKPANVLLSAEGIPKLADFNVSFAGCAGRAGAAASFGGSIGYMSPEHLQAIQSRGTAPDRVGEAADFYSLAVLLWELWQGNRPFATGGTAPSWSEAIDQQLVAREQPLLEPRRVGGAAERVLESVLRSTLSYDPQHRPASGAAMACRLRLALHPDAAELFDLRGSRFRSQLLNRSPWLLATFIILLPNIAGGLLNFQYNYHQIMTDQMRAGLSNLSWYVNLVFFPLGAAIVIWFAFSVIRAVRAARMNLPVSPRDVDATLDLGNRSALIGGTLWLAGGAVFPTALHFMYPDFTAAQAVHLMISSLICGGVAMIYPFFGMAIVATWVYYPCFVGVSMEDKNFSARRQRMIIQSEVYLLIAALIPLLGAALLISNESSSRVFMLAAIAAGVTGLLASSFVYRWIVRKWTQMSEVLATKSGTLNNAPDG